MVEDREVIKELSKMADDAEKWAEEQKMDVIEQFMKYIDDKIAMHEDKHHHDGK